MTAAQTGQIVREVLRGDSSPPIGVGAVVREVLYGKSTPVNAGQVVREVLWRQPAPAHVGQVVREVLWKSTGAYVPGTGSITLTGPTPLFVPSVYVPGPAEWPILLGLAPTLVGGAVFQPGVGSIVWQGFAPVFGETGVTFHPPTGAMFWGGLRPALEPLPFFDYRETVISQYANSPTILQMVANFDQWIAPGQNLQSFYELIWDLDTAEGYGLDVWGRIVGVGRILELPGDQPFFGFEESTTELGFNQAPFYSGGNATSNFALTDAAFRVLILAKALANICNGSIPAINQILVNLFPGQQVYVVDGENMTMEIVFTVAPTPVQLAIVENSGVIPKPAGVALSIVT